jgi:hypothetical protein
MTRLTGNSSDADPPTEQTMPTETLTETIRRELPALLRQDPELRRFILDLTRGLYADRAQTEDRFDRLLDELRRDREEQTRKWDESKKEFAAVHEEIMAQARKFDRSIGALGARWGLQSEAAFRNALAGILEQSFGVTVRNVCEFDDTGEVFGRPDQVELDIIIKNGLLLILELKSSMDKAGIYSFERKARFYERRHQRQADRLIVVSPMIEPKALAVARELGIETYSDSLEVPSP